jgi:pimeloyl-ACP methyl ester carboxylesterase
MSVLLTALLVFLLVMAVLAIGTITFSAIAERRNPPIGKFVEAQGLHLHYIERGNPADPVVVVFHGNGSMIQDMTISGLIDLLSRRNRVVCFDRPGFGQSTRTRFRFWTPGAQAELFAEVLPKIGISNPIVVGHSWGTLVAVALALRDDYQVQGLTLASGYYFPTTSGSCLVQLYRSLVTFLAIRWRHCWHWHCYHAFCANYLHPPRYRKISRGAFHFR